MTKPERRARQKKWKRVKFGLRRLVEIVTSAFKRVFGLWGCSCRTPYRDRQDNRLQPHSERRGQDRPNSPGGVCDDMTLPYSPAAPDGTTRATLSRTRIMPPNDAGRCAAYTLWVRDPHKPPCGARCRLGLLGCGNGPMRDVLEL